jgi:ribosome-dependent ATPase
LIDELGNGDEPVLVRPISPTLEDVFVTLTRAAEDAPNASQLDTEHAVENALVSAVQPAVSPATSLVSSEESIGGSTDPSTTAVASDAPPSPSGRPHVGGLMWGFLAMLLKEFSHIRRERSTIMFMLVVPAMQTLIFGYAIQQQIENIPTVFDHRPGSRW